MIYSLQEYIYINSCIIFCTLFGSHVIIFYLGLLYSILEFIWKKSYEKVGALTFNAVTVSLSTDVGTVCDLIQFFKEHLWLFQVQQETMSYHTHHVHHGKSLIKSLQRKRGSVCMCVCQETSVWNRNHYGFLV